MSSTVDALVQWVAGRLAHLMGLAPDEVDSAHEMACYLCSMEDERELQEYVTGVLCDAGDKAVKNFTRDFLQRRRDALTGPETPAMTVYKKDDTSSNAVQPAVRPAEPLSTTPARESASSATVAATGANSDAAPEKRKAAPAATKKKKSSKPTAAAASAVSTAAAAAAAAEGCADASLDDAAAWGAPAMSSFFAQSAAMRQAMPQLRSAPKGISEGRTTAKQPKPKYVNFMERMNDGSISNVVPGRHFCECMASKHKLINNCLQCGRIVCEQEGIGPCMHCGSLVVTPAEQDLLRRDSKQTRTFVEKLMRECGVGADVDPEVFRLSGCQTCTSATAESLARANQRRERLLEYDRNSAQRSRVIDDEADYFNAEGNKWLSRKERDTVRAREDNLRRKKDEKRKERTVTIDLVGRRVIDDQPAVVDVYEEARLEEDRRAAEATAAAANLPNLFGNTGEDVGPLDNPMLEGVAARPEFRAAAVVHELSELPQRSEKSKHRDRIQDKTLAEMSDTGKCMSLHQPWASLLVYGIKMHEGRVWSSPHRGRLWIAAAAKEPDPEEIAHLEAVYRAKYGPDVAFPKEYPTACLLGFVDVEDVMAQDDYRQRFPDGDSAMPYVFVCNNPHELIVRYPMKGQHKIYSLDKATHENAKSCVRPVEVTWSPSER